MNLDLDLELIKSISGMTLNRLAILTLLYKEERNWLKDLDLLNQDDLLYLQNNGYLLLGDGTAEGIILRPEAKKFFEGSEDQMWIEFCNTFPYKVPTTRGSGSVRILRTLDPMAESNKKIKKKYLAIVKGKPSIHSHIMECLKKQLEVERDRLSFFNNIDTWLNQRVFEKYSPMLKDKELVKISPFGEYSKDL